jgi:hypothetical protein
MIKHEIGTERDQYGHKAVCSCGGFTLGYFPSANAAKRAGMNCSHGDEQKPRAELVEVKQ